MKEACKYTGNDLYDYCCGYVLASKQINEDTPTQENEKIITALLERFNAGAYDADRAAYIQNIIFEIQREVLSLKNENPSKFYIRKESAQGYSSYGDVDIEAMADHFKNRYSDISRSIIERWITYSVYIWYLR